MIIALLNNVTEKEFKLIMTTLWNFI